MKLALFCVLWSVFCGPECVWGNETCPEGLYTAESGIECCLCPKGYYVERDCSSPGGLAVCLHCADGTYLDYVNSERKCERCKTCSSNENMEEESRCSVSSNRVCRCVSGHYCDQGHQCKVCYPCSTCEGFEVDAPCSPTSDTQCGDTTRLSAGIIALIVLLCVAAAVFLLVFIFWKKKVLFCFKSSKTPEHPELTLELLDDLDLEPLLPGIAEVLGFRGVRNLVKRLGLSQTNVDNVMDEHPHDAKERAHQLLLAWYQEHGMRGAYGALMNNLISTNMRVKAEQVQKLVREERRERGTARNGAV